MELINDLIEKKIHCITGIETTLRTEYLWKAKKNTNKKRKQERGYVKKGL